MVSDNFIVVEVEACLVIPGFVLLEPDVELVNLFDNLCNIVTNAVIYSVEWIEIKFMAAF